MAVSDPLGLTAQGLPNLERTTKRADLAELVRQVQEREVSLILIGNPLNMSGSEGRQSGWVRELPTPWPTVRAGPCGYGTSASPQ